jgi:zinc transporter
MTFSDIAADAAPASGIVWAYRFLENGSAQAILAEAIDQALADHRGWIWIHLGLADKRCRAWIEQCQAISPLAREMLTDADEHLRLDIVGSEIIGIMPDLHQELAQEAEELVRLRFVMTERLMLTARRKPVHSIETQRRAIESGRLFPTAISFLDAVIEQFADAIAVLTERMGDELDVIEDHVLHEELGDERQRLGRVRLQSVRVRRQLSQLRSLFQRLERRIEAESKPITVALRLLTQKLDALEHETGSLYERARLLQDEIAAKMTAITNRRLFTLSVLTATLLPPTLVTGFFGMNTKDLPFQNTDGGTWYAMTIGLIAGAVSYHVLRRLQAL